MGSGPITALVPMKAHSERVPGKNVLDFVGKPLFHWIFEALRSSRYIDRIVVNTDSAEIGEEATARFGARVLWRPTHLCGDMIGIQPLIEWDLEHSDGTTYLQTHCTNPLLTADTIDAACERFRRKGDHDSLFSVTQLQTRLYWSDAAPINHDPLRLVRTQDLDPVFEENSCIYLFSRTTFERCHHRIGSRPILFPISPLEAVDIDEPHDLAIAGAIMRQRLGEGDTRVR